MDALMASAGDTLPLLDAVSKEVSDDWKAVGTVVGIGFISNTNVMLTRNANGLDTLRLRDNGFIFHIAPFMLNNDRSNDIDLYANTIEACQRMVTAKTK